MKNKKLFIIPGLLLSVVFLAGCGSNPTPAQDQSSEAPIANPAASNPSPAPNPAPAASTNAAAGANNAQAALPSDVSTQPATTPADEAKNIDKDLKAMDSANSKDSLSNSDLGL